MIYYQLKTIYLPGKNDLFAKQKWFILNHKTLGTIQLFWQAVLRINHLNGSHHSETLLVWHFLHELKTYLGLSNPSHSPKKTWLSW